MEIIISNTSNSPKLSNKYKNILKDYNLTEKETNVKHTMKIGESITELEEKINLSYIEVSSFDFLPELENKLKENFKEFSGLIFRSKDGFPTIEIYDDYRE